MNVVSIMTDSLMNFLKEDDVSILRVNSVGGIYVYSGSGGDLDFRENLLTTGS